MKHSIKAKLILGLAVTITVPAVIIIILLAVTTRNNSYDSFVDSTTREIRQVDYAINLFLDESLKNADMMAKNPLAMKVGQVTTSHVYTTSSRSAAVDPGDTVGREMVDFFASVQETHPAYVEVFVGSENGAFVSALESSDMPAGYDPRKRPWYKEAKPYLDKPILSKAYMSTTGQPVTSATRTIVRNGQVLGVMGIDISLKKLTDLIKSVRLGKTGYLVMVQDDGVILAEPKHEKYNFKNVAELDSKHLNELFAKGSGTTEFSLDGKEYIGLAYTSPAIQWKLIGVIEKDEIMAPVYSAIINMVVIFAVTLGLLVGVIWIFMDVSAVRPLKTIAAFVQEVASGDFTRRLKQDRKDEIGQICMALDNMADNLEDKARLATAIAGGDLTRDVTLASDKDSLGKALKTMTANLNDVMHSVRDASEQIDSGSSQVSDSSQALAQGAAEQASSLEEITSSMTQIASQTKANAENAAQANRNMDEAQRVVGNGREAGNLMASSMTEISNASQEMAKIIKVIDEIAFQTNLLALNAAVEAARAGRHGKGFAVVAEEVRNLAGRSAKAAQETTQLIETALEKVNAGQELTERLDASFEEIVTSASKVGDLVLEISASSNEQAEGVSQVNTGLSQIDQVTQQNTASAEETASAAEELSSQATSLRNIMTRFKLKQGVGGQRQVVRSQPAGQLPQAERPRKPASTGGWGGVGGQSPEDLISLDDDDFGKY